MLFYRPLPQQSKSIKDIYSFFKTRMFPGEDNFIRFLEADTLDEQMRYAIEILKRLCFESNFPPPYSALLDVLNIENAEKNTEYHKNQHIARDHFLHVVYLYMLGIYLFFYDKLFFEKITDVYKYKRNSHDYENKEYDSIKDFISAWKYFSLYHDIGYSVEKLSNANNSIDTDKIKNFMYSFKKENIHKELVTSSTIKALSHLVVLKQMINNSHTLFDKNNILYDRLNKCNVTSYHSNGIERNNCIFKDVIECYKNNSWLLIDKIYSNSCLKLVLSVLKRIDFIILAFYKNNGQQAFCITPNEDGSHSVHLFEGCRKSSIINEIIRTPEIVFYDDYRNHTFSFQYYLNQSAEKGLLSSETNYSLELDKVVTALPTIFNTEYVRINSEHDLRNYYYNVYDYFNMYISSTENNSDVYTFIDEQKDRELDSTQIYNKSMELVFSNETKDKVYNSFFKKLSENTQSTIDHRKIHVNGDLDITAYVREYVNIISFELEKFIISKGSNTKFQNFKKRFINETADEINSNLEFRISILTLYCKLLKSSIDLFSHRSSELYYDYNTNILQFEMGNFENIICNKFKNAFCKIDNNITGEKEIVNSYNVPFDNKYDHGIVSSYLYAFVSDTFNETIINSSSEQKELLAVMLNFSFDNEEMQKRNVNNYHHIQEDVFYALFIHNISPKCFKEKYRKYRTNINDPFSYLGMLSDALQQWNRPHTIHPSVFDIAPNIDSSNEYDIKIEDDYIVVYEANNKDIQGKLAQNLGSFSQYLESPDAFVKCGYSKMKP